MRISEAFKLGRPTFSFEFLPPRTDQAARDLFKTIDHLQALRPDFVTVTYGAGGSTRERTIELVTDIKHRLRIEVAAHLTCVGHSADEIGAIAERLRRNGIENLMALRGDPPRGQERFTKMGASIPAALRERLATVDGDDKAVVRVGVEWATAEAEALLAGGAPGIHFYTLNRSFATREIFTRLQAERPRSRRT